MAALKGPDRERDTLEAFHCAHCDCVMFFDLQYEVSPWKQDTPTIVYTLGYEVSPWKQDTRTRLGYEVSPWKQDTRTIVYSLSSTYV